MTKAYSRYESEGKGLTDEGEREYAAKLTPGSAAHRDYTTYVTKDGVRKASGTFQAQGHTAASLGYSGVLEASKSSGGGTVMLSVPGHSYSKLHGSGEVEHGMKPGYDFTYALGSSSQTYCFAEEQVINKYLGVFANTGIVPNDSWARPEGSPEEIWDPSKGWVPEPTPEPDTSWWDRFLGGGGTGGGADGIFDIDVNIPTSGAGGGLFGEVKDISKIAVYGLAAIAAIMLFKR